MKKLLWLLPLACGFVFADQTSRVTKNNLPVEEIPANTNFTGTEIYDPKNPKAGTAIYVGVPSFSGAKTYRDAETGIFFYLESDGRHVAAISPDGKLLWNRDPFADAHLEFYRTDKPQIVRIGKPIARMTRGTTNRVILINYNSTQTGTLDMQTGKFEYLGQD